MIYRRCDELANWNPNGIQSISPVLPDAIGLRRVIEGK
jgi:hypothetical protein